jgi:hypothetical protein
VRGVRGDEDGSDRLGDVPRVRREGEQVSLKSAGYFYPCPIWRCPDCHTVIQGEPYSYAAPDHTCEASTKRMIKEAVAEAVSKERAK